MVAGWTRESVPPADPVSRSNCDGTSKGGPLPALFLYTRRSPLHPGEAVMLIFSLGVLSTAPCGPSFISEKTRACSLLPSSSPHSSSPTTNNDVGTLLNIDVTRPSISSLIKYLPPPSLPVPHSGSMLCRSTMAKKRATRAFTSETELVLFDILLDWSVSTVNWEGNIRISPRSRATTASLGLFWTSALALLIV